MLGASIKRVAVALLALVFIASATAEMASQAMASPPCPMSMGTSADGDGMPCKGMIPTCINDMGLPGPVHLPARPTFGPGTAYQSIVRFVVRDDAVAGRVVEPELSPPIRRA